MGDLKDFMHDVHRERMKNSIDMIVKYCRYIQKKHIENGWEISGIDELNNALQQGVIKADMFDKLREAVVNYDAPYEIVIQD